MKNLIGKKFRYKSKYGGLSSWSEEIIDLIPFYDTDFIDDYDSKKLEFHEISYVKTRNSVYKLDEIEIID